MKTEGNMDKNGRTHPQYIIHYGLSRKQIDALGDCLPEETVLHDATTCATDIIALCPTLAVVINPTAMPQNDLTMILDYYSEVDWYTSERIFFTAKVDIPKATKITYLDDNDFISGRIYALLSKANSKIKKNKAYHERIVLCLLVLKTIRNMPGISTKRIAEECVVSEKSILRYIETLRISGEWIEYDRQARGWKLETGMNSFFN